MKFPWKRLCSVTGLAIVLATSASAADQPCAAGCGRQDVVCLKMARMTAASCRMGCLAGSAPADIGGCVSGCVDTARGGRAACRSDLVGCVQQCSPAPSAAGNAAPTPACLGGCGADLGTCARNVAAGIRTCVAGCRTDPDHAGCLAHCASTAQSSAASCASDFRGCTADCQSTTTIPGPPSTTTTMPGAPGCGDPTDQACGGRCLNPGDVCQNVSGGCACIPR